MKPQPPPLRRSRWHPYRLLASRTKSPARRDDENDDDLTLLVALLVAFVSAMARVVVAVIEHERFRSEPTFALLITAVTGPAIPRLAWRVWRRRK